MLQPDSSFVLFAASGVEFLVVLLLMAGSALVNWLQKRKQKETDWSEVERRPDTGGKPSAPVSWEEELRKILEGETPDQRPAPPAPPAPPVIPERRPAPKTFQPPASPPVPSQPVPPPPARRQTLYRGHCEHCAGHIEFPSDLMGEDIHCPHCYRLTRLYPFTETAVERRAHPPQPSPAPQPVPSRPKPAAAMQTDKASAQRTPEIREVVALLQNPRSARQAMLASFIVGPPKSLE